MSDYPVRKAVGNTLRSPLGGSAITLSCMAASVLLVGPYLVPTLDDVEGSGHQQSIEKIDTFYNNLMEQKDSLTKLDDDLEFIRNYDAGLFDTIYADDRSLSNAFRTNSDRFIKSVFSDDNLSEQDVLEYMTDLENNIIDPVELGYEDLNEDSDYIHLRECRTDNGTDISAMQSCMNDESDVLSITAGFMGGMLGTLSVIIGTSGSIGRITHTDSFRRWENGKSKPKFGHRH